MRRDWLSVRVTEECERHVPCRRRNTSKARLLQTRSAYMTASSAPHDLVATGTALKIPPLDHGAIGNGRVIALVSPTSAIEWLCLPRFDSPAVFARLLDTRKGGSFRILYGEREVRGTLAYLPNTNVLSTRFEQNGDAWEVI